MKKNKFFFKWIVAGIVFATISFFAAKTENSPANETNNQPKIGPLIMVSQIKSRKDSTSKKEIADDFWLSAIKINWKKIDFSRKLKPAPIKKMEVVSSAYYRPLKNQRKFALGSYLEDIRLNGAGHVTSSQVRPKVGTIAADPKILPMGTVVEIPNYGLGIVQDTGEEIKGNRIDLFMGEGMIALEKSTDWGVKTLEIRILGILSLG